MFIELPHPETGATFINVDTSREFHPEYGHAEPAEGSQAGTRTEPTALSIVIDRGPDSVMTFAHGTYPTRQQAETVYASFATTRARGGIGTGR